MRTGRLLLMVLVGCATAPVRAGQHVELQVSPSVAFEPATVMVRAMIDARHEHRVLEVIAESADYYRSSSIQLDGEHAPRTNQSLFRGLPSGQYSVRVTVRGQSGEVLAQTERGAHIVDRGAEPLSAR